MGSRTHGECASGRGRAWGHQRRGRDRGSLSRPVPSPTHSSARASWVCSGERDSSSWASGSLSPGRLAELPTGPHSWQTRPMFEPIRTHRLLIRGFRDGDAVATAAIRNHPDVARYQDWTLPYPLERAERVVSSLVAMDGPTDEEWRMAVVADAETGDTVGFVMLALPTDHHPEPYLWRLLIDRMHQRRGIGGRALGLLEVECRAMGAGTLLTSWVEGRGSPGPSRIFMTQSSA